MGGPGDPPQQRAVEESELPFQRQPRLNGYANGHVHDHDEDDDNDHDAATPLMYPVVNTRDPSTTTSSKPQHAAIKMADGHDTLHYTASPYNQSRRRSASVQIQYPPSSSIPASTSLSQSHSHPVHPNTANSPATAEKGMFEHRASVTTYSNHPLSAVDEVDLQGAIPGTPAPFHLHVSRSDQVEPPMRSPSLTKPFVRNPHIPSHHSPNSASPSSSSSRFGKNGLVALFLGNSSPSSSLPISDRRRRGVVYAIALVGGCITFVVLLIVLLASISSSALLGPSPHGDPYAAAKAANSLRRAGSQDPLGDSLLRSNPSELLSSALADPKGSLYRIGGYLSNYLPFLDSYTANNMLMGGMTSSAILFGHLASGVHTLHPILPILRRARQANIDMMARQSTTYAQVCSAYRRKYKQNPPPGFDKWWSFAKARNHTMVDEYDSLMRDVAKFAILSPEQLQERTRTLAQLPGVSLISIKGGQAQIHSKSGKWAPALAMQEMMNAFVSTLPDMEIAINEKPEGRVLPGRWKDVNLDDWGDEDFPLEEESPANITDPLASYITNNGFKVDWRRDGSVWEAFRRACPPDSAARRLVEAVRSAETSTNSRQMRLGVASAAKQQQTDVRYLSSLSRRRAESSGALPRTRELSFATDVDATLDLCAWPSLHSLHSAFFSDTRSIQHLYPLFSPSKPSGFADLLIPFHQYWSPPSEVLYENEYRKGRTKEPADLDWENKDDKVFWRGKITRGADTPAGHAESFQKARLVALANDDGSTWVGKEGDPNRKRVKPKIAPHRVLVTVNATSSSLVSMSAPGPKINEYTMDVAMACDAQLGECAEQIRLGYKVTNPGPLSEAWQHRYVVDLDEVGLSSRFPALMESKSAVIRSSVQHEFWQDWIVPWYHYIPLSTSYAELFNIQAFFSGFPKALQNRRSTAASAPQKDESGDEFAETEDVDVSILSGPSQEGDDGAQTTQAGEVTLRSESISLKPINPAHGDSFDGNLALKDIADAGSQWRTTHMRREDMEVYVFRLLLEYARLLHKPAEAPQARSVGNTNSAKKA